MLKDTLTRRKERQEYLCCRSTKHFISRCNLKLAFKLEEKAQVAVIKVKELIAPKKAKKARKTRGRPAKEVVGSDTESETGSSDSGNE